MLPVQTEYRCLHEVVPTPALYIYETVELELSLATVSIETDESLTDYFSCPLRLSRGTETLFYLVLVFGSDFVKATPTMAFIFYL